MRRDYVIEILGTLYYAMLAFVLHFGQLGHDSLINYLVRFYLGV